MYRRLKFLPIYVHHYKNGQITIWIRSVGFWYNNHWNCFLHTLLSAQNKKQSNSWTSEDIWVKSLKLGTNDNLI